MVEALGGGGTGGAIVDSIRILGKIGRQASEI